MEKGNIQGWSKSEGDELAEGDVLCQIETDKATMDFETPDEGFLAKILQPAGTKDIPVGMVRGLAKTLLLVTVVAFFVLLGNWLCCYCCCLSVLLGYWHCDNSLQGLCVIVENKDDIHAFKDFVATAAAAAPAPATPAPAPAAPAPAPAAPAPAPAPATPAQAATPAATRAAPTPVARTGERIFASPLARKLAQEKGIDLSVSAF